MSTAGEQSCEADHAEGLMPSAAQLLEVLHGLPGMVGFWDQDLRNVVANRAYAEYFDVVPAAVRGMHIRDLLGEALYAENVDHIQRALAGENADFDRTLTDRQGRARHLQVSYVPSRAGGQLNGFFVLVTDVTQRVEAERAALRSAEQYRALAASVPDGFVLLFDTDLRVLIADGTDLAAFGHHRHDLEGRTVNEAFPAWLATELEPRYRAALSGQRVEWERRIKDRIFSLKATPVTTAAGEIFAGMVIAQDVTGPRRAQAVYTALHEIATSVARRAAPDMVFAHIAVSLTTIFNADTAAVVRFDGPERGEILAMAPLQPSSVPRVLHLSPHDGSALAQVAVTGQAALVTYGHPDGGVVAALRAEGLSAGACAPIHHSGVLWGAVSLGMREADQLTPDVLDELSRFAELAHIALGNLDAWTALTEQAACDTLTGLPNRRSFDSHLHREIDAAARAGDPLSLILLDIDHFKAVNDTHGHPIGDRVLAEVAAVLGSVCRQSEMIARIGGEEFAWLLPRTPLASARHAAERARQRIASHDFGDIGPLTISLGITTTADPTSPTELITAADTGLYQAKRAGRNRAVAYQPNQPNRNRTVADATPH